MKKASKEEIISIQARQLAEWKPKLRDEVYKDLEEWALAGNDVFDDHYDIRRGAQLTHFVERWQPKETRIEDVIGEVNTKVTYIIADLEHPMYHTSTFNSLDDAMVVLKRDYTNRDRGDGHDEYWKGRRTGIQKIITTVEVVFDNKKQSDEIQA